ncbi:hypothetical protein BKA70DRAFT_1524723 [Coprinopsis sp. MPI-PUGE-AT-0042]|nr:hypothetical protein BKA70DRAFT_1524723 [Coprinopsis sp. MPI-PUGE-AT-0042]
MPINDMSFHLPYGPLSSLVYARYTQALLRRIFDPSFPLPESDIDIRVKAELQQIARVVSEARRNIHRIPWNINEYSDNVNEDGYQPLHNDKLENARGKVFPAPFTRADGKPYMFRFPAIFVDKHGVIIWWYLPGIISKERQESIDQCVKDLGSAPGTPLRTDPGGDWRTHESLYTRSQKDRLKTGTVTLSPATYLNGVDDPYFWELDGSVEMPSPSPPFETQDSGAQQFAERMTDSFAILSTVLACTDSRQYDAGLNVLESIYTGRLLVDSPTIASNIMAVWGSPFTHLSVDVNHEILVHRDLEQPPPTYVSLTSIGRYKQSFVECPGMGVQFLNPAGTMMMGVTGILEYGFSKPSSGDIIVLKSVFEGRMLASWTNLAPTWPPKISGWDLVFLPPNANIDQTGWQYVNSR